MYPRYLILTLGTAALACSGEQPKTDVPVQQAAISVHVADVADTAVAAVIRGTGVTAASEEATLSFKIGGVVARVLSKEGDRVRAGQVLAALDLREIDALVAKAQAARDKAERDHARMETLYRDSVITLAQFQDAATAQEVATSDLEVAQLNRRYAQVTAPSAGVVLRTFADGGELVNPGTPILSFGSSSGRSVVKLALADREAIRIAVGDRAEVHIEAMGAASLAGRVSRIAGGADPMTGTYAVEVALDSPRVLSGLTAVATISPTPRSRARLIPIESVVEADGQRAVVYSLHDDGATARRHEVTLGAMRGAQVAVLSGLDNVRTVITTGAPYLSEGAAVRVAQ